MAKKSKPTATMSFPASFGNVSVGERTCRIGVTIDRSKLKLNVLDGQLCEKRLTGTIVIKPNDEADGQGRLEGMDGVGIQDLNAVFDLKGYRATKKEFNFGLTMAIESIKIEDLAHFAQRSGTLEIDGIEELPEAPKRPSVAEGKAHLDGADDEEDEEIDED